MSDQLSPQSSSEETADEPDKDDGMVFWIRQEHENVKILILFENKIKTLLQDLMG